MANSFYLHVEEGTGNIYLVNDNTDEKNIFKVMSNTIFYTNSHTKEFTEHGDKVSIMTKLPNDLGFRRCRLRLEFVD